MYYNTNYNIIQLKVIIMALTTDSIHAAADKLHAQGITPTQTKVREALGGGSFSTIGEALKSWKQDKQEHEQLKQTDMPDSLRDESTVFVAKLWQAADLIANERLTAERQALAIAQSKSQQELDDAAEAIEALESEQTETLNSLRISRDSEERAVAETQASAAEILSLSTANTELQHKLDIEQERTASATSSLRATNEKLDSTRSQLDDANNQITQARENIATLKATSSAQVADIERLQADAIEHKQAHQIIIEQLTERTAERDDLAKQLASVIGKLEAVTEQSKQLVVERDNAISDNKALAATNSKLEATNESLVLELKQLKAATAKLKSAK